VMKPRIPSKYLYRNKQQHQQQMPREWSTMIDLEGFRPEDVTAKLNPKCRILVIKAKTNPIRHQQQTEQLKEEDLVQQQRWGGKKLVRIIPLPENIHLEKLRVKVPTRGELVVKAPFIPRAEFMQHQKQYQRNISSTWIPLEVIIKGTSNVFGTQHQHTKTCFKNKRCQRGQKNEERVFGGEGHEWNTKKGKLVEGGLYQHHSTFINVNTTNTLRTEYIRDEVTGKPAMLVKVNVIGFLPEEVRVRVVESKRVLIVEATKRSTTTQEMPLPQEERGLTMKYLCREFFLPQFLDVSHIAFRVLKTGVLVIKLPMLKNMKETMFGDLRCRGVEDVEECPLLNCTKWEKIRHCA